MNSQPIAMIRLWDFLTANRSEMIVPVGLSFGMSHADNDLILLQVIGERDSPLRFGGRIIVFEDEAVARQALTTLKPVVPSSVFCDDNYAFTCDIHGAIEAITGGDKDHDSVILNCVNTLLDLIATGPFTLRDEYRILPSFADKLTFQDDFKEFQSVRTLIRDSILWSAGAVVLDSVRVESLTRFETMLPDLCVGIYRALYIDPLGSAQS